MLRTFSIQGCGKMVKIPSKFNIYIYIFFIMQIRLKSQYGVLWFRDLPLKVFLSLMNKPKKIVFNPNPKTLFFFGSILRNIWIFIWLSKIKLVVYKLTDKNKFCFSATFVILDFSRDFSCLKRNWNWNYDQIEI